VSCSLIIYRQSLDSANFGRGDRLWIWVILQLSGPCDLDLGSGSRSYRCVYLIEYYLYTKFHRNLRNFLWTDGRTDGHLTLILLKVPKLQYIVRLENVILLDYKYVLTVMQISVEWKKRSGHIEVQQPRIMHFKISDKNVTLFPPGMSPAVL